MIKLATAKAKESKYDEAIDILESYYHEGEASDADLIKILPYYQKAGRYKELVSVCNKVIIPKLNKVNQATFSHKCIDIQEAFLNLKLHNLYSKLALCAEREKALEDKDKYTELGRKYFVDYEKLLVIGTEIENKKEFHDAVKLYGKDSADWPFLMKQRFSVYLDNL